MKIITFYLPQFHTIPENDEWWGKGFTEWTAVKNATPLFDGHYQPRMPLNGNYYNLLEKSVMENQAALMKKYGVYAQCFYHYYFKNGRKILEKPAENLLSWADIDMPFCFSWANESWVRTWGAVQSDGFNWAPKFSKENIAGTQKKSILLEQSYGDKKDWIEHFYYLLPFFKDSRYVKKDNKPLFLIYRPEYIACLPEMLDCWRQLALKEGLEGLYIIASNRDDYEISCCDAFYCHAPGKAFAWVSSEAIGVNTKDYDDSWNALLSEFPKNEKKLFYGGFVDYDDTPRRGQSGTVTVNVSPKKFEGYLRQLLRKSELYKNDFVFLNAWNEWGEGMYLEPDEKNGYAYLEAVSNAMESYHQINFSLDKDIISIVEKKYQSRIEKYRGYWQLFDMWLFLKEQNISIIQYFEENGINSISVYGMGMMGCHLLAELEQQNFEVVSIIDRKGGDSYNKIPVLTPDDKIFPICDAIIVTVKYDFEQIKEKLSSKTDAVIISLFDIVQTLYHNYYR